MRSRLRRRVPLALALVGLLAGPGAGEAGAHAGLVRSDPAPGAALGASPTGVRLTFSERAEPSLSVVRVLGASGAVQQSGPLAAVPGDPSSLLTPVRKVPRGVYTVTWRSLSAVDGHATSGSFAFGVGVKPTGAAARATSTSPGGSAFEMLARFLLIAGLVALLGAASAAVAGFAGSDGAERRLAVGGWLAAAAGLALLLAAQRRSADVPVADLLDTPVGEALIWRVVAIGVAGLALFAARLLSTRRQPRLARVALGAAGAAAATAMAVHVAAGHAGAGNWSSTISVGAQWAHFAAVGAWIGGLAALLLGLRGAPSKDKAAAVRRFAVVALVGIVVVAAAGTLRAIDELTAVSDLWSGAYGRTILAKIALLVLIATIAVRSRRRAGAADLGPLRRTSRAELLLATAAIALAAVLGTVAPPVAGDASPPGLTATAADFATTVRVKLTAASAERGANSFVVRVTDYDSGEPVRGARVQLRFVPLDDPGVDATTLRLRAAGDGSYAADGANLVFDGRWGVTVLVQRARDTVEVPLELDVPSRAQFISIARITGRPTTYTAQVFGSGYVRIAPDPERAGPSTLLVDVYTIFLDPSRIDGIVVTAAAGSGRAQSLPVRRRGGGRFAAHVNLARGANTIGVVAYAEDGTRVRAVFKLDVPG